MLLKEIKKVYKWLVKKRIHYTKNFLRSRTQSAQVKYKTYKNKLTTILIISEKQYYTKLLVQEKNNMKGTWAILNNIIKKGHQAPSYPQEFVDNGSVVKNSMDIANGFNKFVVDIGHNLAKNIEPSSENVAVENFLGNSNNQSIFLSSVRNQRLSKM